MNICVLLAGGVGRRLGASKPKQFISVLGKPLIVHSLQVYQNSPHIDAVEVVSLPEYMDRIWGYAKAFSLSKVKWVAPGGASCQDSTRNGIFHLEGKASPDDMISVNMSTSVFVDDDILADSLSVARRRGNAFSCLQCVYSVAETADGLSSSVIRAKESHKTINMPWTSSFGKLLAMYRKAYAEGVGVSPSSYMPGLFLAMGEALHMSKDTPLNKIHVTTPEDLEICSAILERRARAERAGSHEILNWS